MTDKDREIVLLYQSLRTNEMERQKLMAKLASILGLDTGTRKTRRNTLSTDQCSAVLAGLRNRNERISTEKRSMGSQI